MNKILKSFLSFCLVFLLLISFSGCYYDVEEELYPVGCDSTNVSYAMTVLPIFTSRCSDSGCHNTASAQGGLIIDTYEPTKLYLIDKKATLIERITWPTNLAESQHMPQGQSKLNDCDLQRIISWIKADYPQN